MQFIILHLKASDYLRYMIAEGVIVIYIEKPDILTGPFSHVQLWIVAIMVENSGRTLCADPLTHCTLGQYVRGRSTAYSLPDTASVVSVPSMELGSLTSREVA